MYRSNVITISKSRLEKCQSFMWESAENIFVATDVTKLHANGGSGSRTLFITTAAVYILRSSFGRLELANKYTVIDLNKVSYISPNTLILTFKEKQLVFRTDDALDIGKIVLNMHSTMFYQVPNGNSLHVESTPPDALVYRVFKQRPISLLQSRLVVLANYYNVQFPSSCIRLYRTWDHNPGGKFIVDSQFSFHDAGRPIAHGISLDSEIKHLVFKSFVPDQLGPTVSVIFAQSYALVRFCLEDYSESSNVSFDLHARPDTSIGALLFNRVSLNVVVAFLKALSDFQGRILSLSIQNCSPSLSEMDEIFEVLKTNPCFMKLRSLRFDNVPRTSFSGLPSVLSRLQHLTNLIFENLPDEATSTLSMIIASSKTAQTIEFSHCHFEQPLGLVSLPETLLLLDVSQSKVSSEFFTNLLKSLLTTPRKRPVVFDASHLSQPISIAEIFRPLLQCELQPALVELDWSGNPVNGADFEFLLAFLKTQVFLNFLGFSNCVISDAEKVYSGLSQLISGGTLKGLDITNDKIPAFPKEALEFVRSLMHCEHLKAFFNCNFPAGDSGMEVLAQMVESNPSLSELSVDCLGLSSAQVLCKFYNRLTDIKSLKALSTPKKELSRTTGGGDQSSGELKQMMMNMKKKKSPSNINQRLEDYQKVAVDFESGDLEDNSLYMTVSPNQEVKQVKQTSVAFRIKANPLDDLLSMMNTMVTALTVDGEEKTFPHIAVSNLMSELQNPSMVPGKMEDKKLSEPITMQLQTFRG